MNSHTFSIFCALVVIGLAWGPAEANEGCIDDWSVAAPVVKAEGLASVAAVTDLARKKVKGDVIKVTLCMKGPRYLYRLLVRGADGRLTPIFVDAKEPFAR